jgi:tRNA threonylcarbamoyladenosine biosynthesis protein TsaB
MLLALDTSTNISGIALFDGSLRAEVAWDSGRNHTAQILPQLDLLLRQSQLQRADLRAVAVALGPGSWSGLRVGMSIAKGICLAADLPLLGIGTLDAIASQQAPTAMPVYPLIRLGRDRFATAEFRMQGTRDRREPDRNSTLKELAAAIDDRALFCGDVEPPVQAELRQLLGERASFPSPAALLRRPGYLAALAWQRFAAGERDNLVTLEPIYLSEAVKPKE